MKKIKNADLKRFDKWFKKQFGRLPKDFKKFEEIQDSLSIAQCEVTHIKMELDWARRITIEYKAALQAANATLEKFKVEK
jgi:hypothetical protein